MSYFSPSTGGSQRGSHRSRRGRKAVPVGSAWSRFKADLRDVKERYVKRSSAEHKRLVLLLLLLAAVLRAILLMRPVTAEEALAYMTFARQPIGGLLSDYSLPANHLLHTLLSKWSTGIFGVNVVALRLPALLAGLLVLPFYYLFVRAMFNRYIAVMALALAAMFPAQAELGALALGYSMVWLAFVVALALGRHLLKENNPWTAILIGVVLALGMWAHPSMLFAALLVLFWLLFSLLGKYDRSLKERLAVLGIAASVFVALTVLLYLPIIGKHSLDHLFRHLVDTRASWKEFRNSYPDQALALWAWLTDQMTGWAGLFGFIAVVQAAYISVKYRLLLLAMLLGAVPITLLLHSAGHPFQWSYALLVLHLGSAIGLFYLLKFVQDHIITALAKRTRTVVAALILAIGCGLAALLVRVDPDPYGRLPEAEPAAAYLATALAPGDGLCAIAPWDHALRFGLLSAGQRAAAGGAGSPPQGTLFIAVETFKGGSPANAFLHCGINADSLQTPKPVRGWPRLEIFAARKR